MKVFLTGATGYIGGDLLYVISGERPEWEITCIVRTKEKGEKVRASFPKVHLVYGDNNSTGLIEEEAAKADIIYHTSASDEDVPSAKAIARGLARSRGYYIHTSGGLGLAAESVLKNNYGKRFDHVYDDWSHVDEIISRPDKEPHAKVDHIALSAGSDVVKVSIVAPAVVYGEGRGPDKKHPFPMWTSFLEHKQVFLIEKGDNIWHYVHIRYLSQLYLLLGEAAARGGGSATWNGRGYYLAEHGHYVMEEMLQLAASILFKKGLITNSEIRHLSVEEAEKLMPYSRVMLGANSRGLAIRAKNLLGWKPSRLKFEDCMEDSIELAAKDLK